MEAESNIESQESDTETLSVGSQLKYNEERSIIDDGTFPTPQEDMTVIEEMDSFVSDVDQPPIPTLSKTSFSRQLDQIRTSLLYSNQAYPSPSPSTPTPSQAYGPPLVTFGAEKRKISSETNLMSEKRIRGNKSIGIPKIEEVNNIINHIAPTCAEGNIDLGEGKILEISQTRRKRLYLKALVDNVHQNELPQARNDGKELLKATKQINKVGTIRLADNVNQDAPWNITGMTSTLRHHQVIAAGTMVDWETRDSQCSDKHPKGGILADDMGLGKTIQALALIALRRPNQVDASQGRSATLVVCPAGLTAQWFRQAKQHVNDKAVPRVHIYKSNDRIDENVLKSIDLIITSYRELIKSYSNASSRNANSKPSDKEWENSQRGWLHKQKWLRVICDEAQAMRNSTSKTFQSVKKLNTSCRWALSGTPIANSLEEFYPYFNWLNMPCAADHKDFVATYCSRSYEGDTNLLQNLFTSCMIRRTMNSQLFGRAIVWLPLSHRQIEDVQLSHQERVLYDYLHDTYKTIIKTWNYRGNLQSNRAMALKMITTLRQTVSHIALAKNSLEIDLKLEDIVKMRGQLDKIDPGGELQIINTVELWIIEAKEKSAITCSKSDSDSRLQLAVNDETAQKSEQRSPWLLADGTLLQSSKIRLLEQRLKIVFSEAPGNKVVIFTHFLNMISIVARLCQDNNWTHATYNGGMSSKDRDDIVQSFQLDSGPQILIASIRAAGEGLTLTQANHVFCCEMWWNSACDFQAFCRVYRIGQTRETYFSRLKATGTVDDRIHELQEAKKKLITGVIPDTEGNFFTSTDILTAFGIEPPADLEKLGGEVFPPSEIDDDEEEEEEEDDDDDVDHIDMDGNDHADDHDYDPYDDNVGDDDDIEYR